MKTRSWFITVFGRRIGLESSRLHVGADPYMDRVILYFFGPCVRFHKFYRGDDDRAPHDHPWPFVTFPFADYEERVWDPVTGQYLGERIVSAFNFHFRPAQYRHIVMRGVRIERLQFLDGSHGFEYWVTRTKPFWAIVFAGKYMRPWGFWPTKDKFVPWREFDGKHVP